MIHWVCRSRCGGAALVVTALLVGCAPSTPVPTRLTITTKLTVCGGVVPPPGEPFCRTNPTSAAVSVRSGPTVVAEAMTGADGMVTLSVPSGDLIVSRTDAAVYLICDSPAVHVVAGMTAAVTQECVLNAP